MKKKIFSMFLVSIVAVNLLACSSEQSESTEQSHFPGSLSAEQAGAEKGSTQAGECMTDMDDETGMPEIPFNTEEYSAVFERNGELLYFDSDTGTIEVLSAGGKYNPTVSKDGTRILYRKSAMETENNELIFGVIGIDGAPLCEIKVDTEMSNEIMNVSWITDELVGVETHINPATSEYFVYNIEKQEMEKYFVGSSFAVIPGTESVMYQENVPHWSDEQVYHSFYVDDKLVYTSEIKDANLCTPVFSNDATKAAFMETDSDGSFSRIIICSYDVNECSMQKQSSIIMTDPQIAGQLTFNEEGKICLVNAGITYWYDNNVNSFLEDDVETNLLDEAQDSKKSDKLQNALTEMYGDSKSDHVNSINWFKTVPNKDETPVIKQ